VPVRQQTGIKGQGIWTTTTISNASCTTCRAAPLRSPRWQSGWFSPPGWSSTSSFSCRAAWWA